MKTLLYFTALALTLPGLALSVVFLTISHVQHGRNVLTTVYEFLMRVTWGVPVAIVALIVLFAAGWLDHSRIWGAGALAVLNLAAFVILIAGSAASRSTSGNFFLLLPLFALAAATWLVIGELHRPSIQSHSNINHSEHPL